MTSSNTDNLGLLEYGPIHLSAIRYDDTYLTARVDGTSTAPNW